MHGVKPISFGKEPRQPCILNYKWLRVGSHLVDVRYVNPFIGAVRNLFQTKLETDIVFSKPSLKEAHEPSPDISAIIGFTGGATGSVSLCFPQRTALRIAGKFAGAEIPADSPDLAGALGELANIVVGQAKTSSEGLNFSISLPKVVQGDHPTVPSSDKMPVLTLPCDSPLGRFWVEVAIARVEQHATAKPLAPATAPQ